MANLALIFSITCVTISLASSSFHPVQVRTKKGYVIGLRGNFSSIGSPFFRGVGEYYLGIPYAKAPVNELRFKAPVDPVQWFTNPLQATEFRPKCPQPHTPWLPPPGNMSEDCLYLNVFTPDSSVKGKYPVMFWIHGGAYTIGGSQDFPTAGVISNLVRRGVVVVTTNYRLGFLGFFTTLTSKFPQNLGLLDQVKALQWTRNEIFNFGGDINAVTLFGESAGGCSVALHTVSPLSRGLFDKAIMQSGTSRLQLCVNGIDHHRPTSRNAAMKLCNITQQQWDAQQFYVLDTCLRTMPWQQIISVQTGYEFVGFENWAPVIDGPSGFIPDWPANLVQFRRDIPVMVGTTKDEFVAADLYKILFHLVTLESFTEGAYSRALDLIVTAMEYGDKVAEIRGLVDAKYRLSTNPPIKPTDHFTWLRTISALFNDKYMFATSLTEARDFLRTNKQNHVYLYSFDYASPGRQSIHVNGYPFVPHTEDIFFVFDVPVFEKPPTVTDLQVIDTIGQLWTSFAKNGTPSINGDHTVWLPTTSQSNKYLKIDGTLTMKSSYQSDADEFWNEYIPSVLAGTTTTQMPAGAQSRFHGTMIWTTVSASVYSILVARNFA